MLRNLLRLSLLLLPVVAFAQTGTPKDKAALQTEINTNLPDQTTGAITPSILRATMSDMLASWQQYATVNAQTGTTYTFVASDYGKLVTFNNGSPVAVTLPAAGGAFASFSVFVTNNGAGGVTITPASGTISGAATLNMARNQSNLLVSTGSNWEVFRGADGVGSAGITPGGANLSIQYNNAGVFGGLTDTQLTARVQRFSNTASGAVPASGGGTTNFLRADGTFAVPAGSGGVMPPTTIVCNNTSVAANPANCLYIVTALTGGVGGPGGGLPGSGWFLNDSPPAKISMFGDRVFIGDAIKYGATIPAPSVGDWYNTYACSFGFCGVNIQNAALVVETSATNAYGTNGIVGLASSLPCLGRNCGFQALTGIAVNNVAATSGKTYAGWGLYAECNNEVFNTGSCAGAEIDVMFNHDRDAIWGTIPANDPFQQGGSNAIQSTCGTLINGFVCDTWLSLQGSSVGSNKFITGINFMHDTVAIGRGPVMGASGANATVAIALPEAYDITWWHDVNTISSAIWGGSSGSLNFATNSTLVVNGSSGVTCAGGINTGTFRSVNGLVTAC